MPPRARQSPAASRARIAESTASNPASAPAVAPVSFDPTSGDFRSALGLDDDDDDDSPGGGSFDDGSFGGSEGAAPTPAGIDGAIAEEDEGEDASPAK